MNGFDLRSAITVRTATRFRRCQRGQEKVLGFVPFGRRLRGILLVCLDNTTHRVVSPEAFIQENTNRHCLLLSYDL